MYRVEMPRDDYNVTAPTLDEAMRIADGLAQDCVALVLVWSMDASMYVGRFDGRW